MAWQLDPSVIAEVAKFKAGDPLWMIYRELGGGNRAVTAVGFPGTAQKPLFVNVRVRTAAYLEGACRGRPREDGEVSQFRLTRGSANEYEAPCWCCSTPSETCEPANRAYEPGDRVTGTIILARCFP